MSFIGTLSLLFESLLGYGSSPLIMLPSGEGALIDELLESFIADGLPLALPFISSENRSVNSEPLSVKMV